MNDEKDLLDEEQMTRQEVALRLRCDPRTVSKYVEGFKIGNEWRYLRRDVEEFIRKRYEEKGKGIGRKWR